MVNNVGEPLRDEPMSKIGLHIRATFCLRGYDTSSQARSRSHLLRALVTPAFNTRLPILAANQQRHEEAALARLVPTLVLHKKRGADGEGKA
jgi:hypothetical protein